MRLSMLTNAATESAGQPAPEQLIISAARVNLAAVHAACSRALLLLYPFKR